MPNKKFPFDHNLKMVLPKSIGGGTLPGRINGVFELNLGIGDRLNAIAEIWINVGTEGVNEALPEHEYSVSVSNTDHPQISTMLGRLRFVPDSASLGSDGNTIFLGARIEGSLFVRQRGDQDQNEKQLENSEPMPIAVDLVTGAENLVLTPKWGLGATVDVRMSLDDDTRASLDGRFGEGQDFANYVERVLNDRANDYAARLDTEGTNLRNHIMGLIQNANVQLSVENSSVGAHMLRIDKVEADKSPSVDDDGAISIGVCIQGHFDLEGDSLPEIPDLELRSKLS